MYHGRFLEATLRTAIKTFPVRGAAVALDGQKIVTILGGVVEFLNF
jgi:hypothetical protein